MSTNVVAWMVAETVAADRDREIARDARARELRATVATRRSESRPTPVDRLRAFIADVRLRRTADPSCCTA